MVAKTESIPTPIVDKSSRDAMAVASSFKATHPQKRDQPTRNFENDFETFSSFAELGLRPD
jgi:hypothetical protein